MTTINPKTLVTFRSFLDVHAAYLRGDRPRLLWSRHALERFVAMKKQGLTADDVSSAICSPDEVTLSRRHSAVLLCGPRATVSVVISPDNFPTVATLLWRTAEDWQESYEKASVDGRERRTDLSHLPARK